MPVPDAPARAVPTERDLGWGLAFVSAAVLGSILVLALSSYSPFDLTSEWIFDFYQRNWPVHRDGGRTVLVAIDDESLRRVGQWPWSRDKAARLVSALSTARSVGLDIIFAEPDRSSPAAFLANTPGLSPDLQERLRALPSPDALLAEALATVPSVLAAAGSEVSKDRDQDGQASLPILERGPDPRQFLLSYPSLISPLPSLAAASRSIGIISAPVGRDGVIRRLPGLANLGGRLAPGFALALVRLGTARASLTVDANTLGIHALQLEMTRLPVDPDGALRPRFAPNVPAIVIPAYKILDGEFDPSAVRDRIVLIGVTAAGIENQFMTPLQRASSGVEIQAQAVESLLDDDLLWRPASAPGIELLYALALGTASILLIGRRIDRFLTIFLNCALLGTVGGSIAAFIGAGMLLDWTLPLSAMGLTSLVSFIFRVRSDRAEQRRQAQELRLARIEAVAALREAEAKRDAEASRQSLSLALSAASLGVYDLDLRTGRSRRSARHDLMFGYDFGGVAPDWNRETLLAHVVDEDRAEAGRSFDTAFETGILQLEARIRLPDRTVRWVSIAGRVFHDEAGTPLRMVWVVADTSDQKQAQSRYFQTTKLQSVGLLAGGLADTFGNLLTIILGNLELSQWAVERGDRPLALMSKAMRAVEDGANITQSLLAFSRQQPLSPEIIRTERELPELLAPALRVLGDRIRAIVSIPDGLWRVEVDRVELGKALVNLTRNAQEAMPEGGRLTVTALNAVVKNDNLGIDGPYVVIAVEDNGRGIPESILPYLFEPFVTTKHAGMGHGLGLSQVHGFVHQSGGTVEVESDVGKGTTIRLYLPACGSQAMPSPIAVSCGDDDAHRPVVLVVEDDVDVATLAQAILQADGYRVILLDRARSALDYLRRNGPANLVFADVAMPGGMNGIELAHQIVKEFPHLPVLLTTAEPLEGGVSGHHGFPILHKPYRAAELYRRVRAMVERAQLFLESQGVAVGAGDVVAVSALAAAPSVEPPAP